MIEKFEDLELETADSIESVETKIQDKLGISVQKMKEALSASVVQNADELATEFVNIAPLGDYSKMLEEPSDMAEFLRDVANKVEHWQLSGVNVTEEGKKLLTFNFANDSVDDGDIFQGFVYVSFEGKIKHAFAQGE
jgi:hypothetical protein